MVGEEIGIGIEIDCLLVKRRNDGLYSRTSVALCVATAVGVAGACEWLCLKFIA